MILAYKIRCVIHWLYFLSFIPVLFTGMAIGVCMAVSFSNNSLESQFYSYAMGFNVLFLYAVFFALCTFAIKVIYECLLSLATKTSRSEFEHGYKKERQEI